ncbi:protein FAM217A [Marmota flaviventris]|uniref:protein FAM217A n=1 Tax=Marmota flaviventris TaxID=93162 RepID=UPI003A83F7FD
MRSTFFRVGVTVTVANQRVVVSPEYLSLPSGHSGGGDKVSWLPEGKVFSTVQRKKIISKFLKGNVLKRVLLSKQMQREDTDSQKEDPSYTFTGIRKILRKQRSSYNKMGRRNGENCGTAVHLSSISQENVSSWSLDSEVPVLENKNLPPGRDSAAGGKINKNHLEIPVEQLMLELNKSERAHRRTQNSKQKLFQLWSYPLNEGSTMENREFKQSTMETGFNVVNNPIRLFTLNHSLTSTPADQQAGSKLGLPMPISLYWPYADGDFLKDRSEFQIDSCSPIETSNGETLSAPNCNLKHGNSSVEEILTDESDLSENENTNDTLLSYFKKMDLKLKPETIENVEESFTEEPSEVFLYPDFLPPPFNTLDLHKFAFSRCENWKATLDSPESSIEQLITRLLELERLQHMTIQKERSRLPSAFCSPAISERPSSSKSTLKARQPKLPDALSLLTSCVDKSREKRKNSSGCGKLEQNASKWNWSGDGKYKWNSRSPSLKSSPTTKQYIATYDDFKNPKSFTSNSCQELSPKPSTTQTTQSLKIGSTRCLPPRSPILVSPIPLSFPENHREEIKSQRTKRKPYQKSILMNRPFYIQKLNCFSPSFMDKGKCSPIDQK